MNDDVVSSTYGQLQLDTLDHLSAQLDITNQSLHSQNIYLGFIAGTIGLIAGLIMFMVGYNLTRR